MNKRLLGLAVAGSMLLGLATSATAGVPDLTQSTASGPASTLQILITPAGLGSNLGTAGATVTVTVRDANGTPIQGFPFQDVTLNDNGTDELNICPGGSVADANTDASGVTTFTGNIFGGGFTQNGLQVYLGGNALAGPALSIDVNSCDITGDRAVNISDVGEFAVDFGSGGFVFRSDFIDDGELNIADVGEFAIHNQEVCP